MGGPTWFQVRISTEPILSRGDQLDVLVAFNEHAYEAHKDEVRKGGVVVYDSKTFQMEDNGSSLGVPFDQLGRSTGNPRAANMVVMGMLAGLMNMPQSILEEFVKQRWGNVARYGEKTVPQNIHGLTLGREEAAKSGFRLGELAPPNKPGLRPDIPERQRGHLPWGGTRGTKLLRRLSDLARHDDPRVDGAVAERRREDRLPGVLRDRGDQRVSRSRVCGQEGNDCHGGAGLLADERGAGVRVDGGDPACGLRRAARRAGDRSSHEDGTVGPVRGHASGPRRRKSPRNRPRIGRGVLLRGRRGHELGREVPRPRHTSERAFFVGTQAERPQARSGHDTRPESRGLSRGKRDERLPSVRTARVVPDASARRSGQLCCQRERARRHGRHNPTCRNDTFR